MNLLTSPIYFRYRSLYLTYVVRCAIWYDLYSLKNVKKKTHGGVLLACNFTKSYTPPWVLLTFLKLYKWYQIAQSITYIYIVSFQRF